MYIVTRDTESDLITCPESHVNHLLSVVSAVNASYLGKNGAVSYLFKVLSSCQKKHLALLKYTLDALASLVKSSQYSVSPLFFE